MEQNQDRRRHFHRSRRGPDRRGPDRRTPPPGQDAPARDGVDVEQIMRDIRARISQRHGIELSNQQIQELAARRLEAILDPRAIKPALLDELKRGAAAPMQPPPAAPEPPYVFDDTTLYESHNGFVRFMRALLKPLLRLLFNPAPIARALSIQSKLNVEAAQRETARARQQAEWNALHYELLQPMVTEISRVSIEMQALTMQVESLSAKVDFNERRVRGIEGVVHQPRSSGRTVEPQTAASAISSPEIVAGPEAAGDASQPPPAPGQPGDGTRRRRRRRRGRRGGPVSELTPSPGGAADTAGEGEADQGFDDNGDEDAPAVAEQLAATAASDVVDPVSTAAAEAPPAEALPAEAPSAEPPPAAPEPVTTEVSLAGEPAPESPERE